MTVDTGLHRGLGLCEDGCGKNEHFDAGHSHCALLRRHGRNARSKIFPLEVDGRFDADAVEIGIEPFLGTRRPGS